MKNAWPYRKIFRWGLLQGSAAASSAEDCNGVKPP